MKLFALLALAMASAGPLPAPVPTSPPDEALDIAPRTPLFCDDGHAMQPSAWGDYGDFVEGMLLKYDSNQYQARKSHSAGGDRYWIGFAVDEGELALFEMTPHQGGWALRAVHDTFSDGRRDVTYKGMGMCGPVLIVLTERMRRQEPDKYLARLKEIAARREKETAAAPARGASPQDSTPH